MSISLTLSAYLWKKLDNWKRKAQAGSLAMYEIVPRQLEMKWMLI